MEERNGFVVGWAWQLGGVRWTRQVGVCDKGVWLVGRKTMRYAV